MFGEANIVLNFLLLEDRLIISTWSFHSCTDFEANSNKFPTIFWSLNFIHFTPQFRLFFLEKKKPKPFSGHKNVMGRGIRKILIFVIKCLKCLKHFRENNIEFLEISKRLEFPLGRPNGYKFYIVPLRMHFWISKSTLDRLKSVFNEFRRKPSLGAPDKYCKLETNFFNSPVFIGTIEKQAPVSIFFLKSYLAPRFSESKSPQLLSLYCNYHSPRW